MRTSDYQEELYSLPVEIINELVSYAKETKQTKNYIVAEALKEYLKERKQKKLVEDALSIIGSVKGYVPDIQEIKANRYDI